MNYQYHLLHQIQYPLRLPVRSAPDAACQAATAFRLRLPKLSRPALREASREEAAERVGKRDNDVASLAHFILVGRRLQLHVLETRAPFKQRCPCWALWISIGCIRITLKNGLHGHYHPHRLHFGIPHHRLGGLQVTLLGPTSFGRQSLRIMRYSRSRKPPRQDAVRNKIETPLLNIIARNIFQPNRCKNLVNAFQ